MRTRRITDQERAAIRRRLPKSDQLITDIAYETGLRISDILSLPANIKSTKLTIKEQKTGKTRTVHITTKTLQDCRRYAKHHPNQTGVLFDCDRSTVFRHITQAAKSLGLENVSAHSYRKAFAYTHYQKYGLKATQEELQHENIVTTMIYVFDWKE